MLTIDNVVSLSNGTRVAQTFVPKKRVGRPACGCSFLAQKRRFSQAALATQLCHSQTGGTSWQGSPASERLAGAATAAAAEPQQAIPNYLITQHIKQSRSLHELQALLSLYGGAFNNTNVAAFVTHTAQTVKQLPANNEKNEASKLLDQCMQCLQELRLLDRLAPRHIANIIWAHGKLGHAVQPPQLMHRMANTSKTVLLDMNGIDLAQTAWGYAKLQYLPNAEWAALFCQATAEQSDNLRPQHIIVILRSTQQLGFELGSPLTLRLLDRALQQSDQLTPLGWTGLLWAVSNTNCESQHLIDQSYHHTLDQLSEFEPQHLANTAAAILQISRRPGHHCLPPATWLSLFCSQSVSVAAQDATAAAHILASVPMLKWPVQHDWPRQMLAELYPRLPSMTSQQLSLTAYALATARPPVDPTWMDAFLSACTAQMQAFGPAQLPQLLLSLALLRHAPHPSWAQSFFVAARQRLADCRVMDLARMLYASAKLRVRPSDRWLAQAMLHLQVKLGPAHLRHRELPTILWSLTQLQVKPAPSLLDAMAAKLLSCSAGMDASHYVAALWGLARLGHRVAPTCASQLPGLFLARLRHMASREVTLGLWALLRIGVGPTPEVAEAVLQRTLGMLPSFPPRDLGLLAFGLTRVRARPSDQWMQAFLAQCGSKAALLSGRNLGAILYFLAELRGKASAWTDACIVATRQQLQEWRPHDLSLVLLSLAKMQHAPDPGWMEAYLAAVGRRLPAYSPMHLAVTICALARLQLHPGQSWMEAFLEQVEVNDALLSRLQLMYIKKAWAKLNNWQGADSSQARSADNEALSTSQAQTQT